MNPESEPKSSTPDSLAPRRGLQLMALILVAMGALAIYSNVQEAQRGRIEKVTVIDESSRPGSPVVSPSPAP